jgi:hypothetical protein
LAVTSEVEEEEEEEDDCTALVVRLAPSMTSLPTTDHRMRRQSFIGADVGGV